MTTETARKAIPEALHSLALFVACLALYILTLYGGIRSPDSEIVFRAAESLASGGGLAVERDIEVWPGFGVARGRDGRLHSVFGPLESIVLAPLARLARALEPTRWWEGVPVPIPISHYVGNGLNEYIRGEPVPRVEPHALRFIASILNPLVTALTVLLFRSTLRKLASSPGVATAVAALFGIGTLAWPYSGTFFSEPLATLFVVASLDRIVASSVPGDGGQVRPKTNQALAGLLLGLAVAAHVTAILFAPFFLWMVYGLERGPIARSPTERAAWLRQLLALAPVAAGLGIPLLLLALSNFAHFGSPLETGRTVDPSLTDALGYGHFVSPWRGLYGLLLGGAKGLILFSPAVLLGLATWRRFARSHGWLAWPLVCAVLFRLLFVAARSDWNGGFSLGPRYLVMAIPLLLLPIGPWLESKVRSNGSRARRGFVALLACFASQQLYFALGEIFTYTHAVAQRFYRVGASAFRDDRIYLDWTFSPLTGLLDGRRGPALLQTIPVTNRTLWLCGSILFAGAIVFVIDPLLSREQAYRNPSGAASPTGKGRSKGRRSRATRR